MVYLLNQDMNNSVRIPWLVVTALAPVLGVLLFCYTKEDVGHRMLKKRLLELEGQTRGQLAQDKKASTALDADCPGAASLAQYLRGRGGGFPVYENTQVTYFPSGEAKFAALLRQLESATQYIFLEYFIIDEGLMWGRILEILARKAAQGVDVRVMYDGTCELLHPAPGLPQTAGGAGYPLQGVCTGHALCFHPLQLPRPPQDSGRRWPRGLYRRRESGRRVHQPH